jgi:hypothetical protein
LPAAAKYFFFMLGDVLRVAQNITKHKEFACGSESSNSN